MMISKKHEDFVWGALLGGAIGAAATLFLTPYSGAEIREQFRNGFNRFNGKRVIKKSAHPFQKSASKKKKKLVTRARASIKTKHI